MAIPFPGVGMESGWVGQGPLLPEQDCRRRCGLGRVGAGLDKASCLLTLAMANQSHCHPLPKRSRDFLPGLPLWPCVPGSHSEPWRRALTAGSPQAWAGGPFVSGPGSGLSCGPSAELSCC